MAEKRSTGPNARPKDETIAQSGEGLPDDTGRVPREAREADEDAARRSLEALGRPEGRQQRPARERPGPKPAGGASAKRDERARD